MRLPEAYAIIRSFYLSVETSRDVPSISTSFLIAFRSVTGERTTTMLSFRAHASEGQWSGRADQAPEGQTFPSACATARLALSLTRIFCKVPVSTVL